MHYKAIVKNEETNGNQKMTVVPAHDIVHEKLVRKGGIA